MTDISLRSIDHRGLSYNLIKENEEEYLLISTKITTTNHLKQLGKLVLHVNKVRNILLVIYSLQSLKILKKFP